MNLTTTLIASCAMLGYANAATVIGSTLTRQIDSDLANEFTPATPADAASAGNYGQGDQRLFFDFDLSSLAGQTITSAIFSANFTFEAGNGGATLFAVDSAWDGTTTRADLYAIDTTTLGTFVDTPETPAGTPTPTFDITALFAAGVDSFEGLAIRGTEGFTETGHSFANAQITFVAVPEPSSTALLGLGGLALIMRRRK